MGQLGFTRRFSKSLQQLYANSAKRYLQEREEALDGKLTLSTLFNHGYEMVDDWAAVVRDLFDWGGSPVLPNVFIQADVAGIVLGKSEVAWLDEPVRFEPKDPTNDFIDVTAPVLVGGTDTDTLTATVELEKPGREEIKVTVKAPAAKVGVYLGLVYRTDVGQQIATVTVHVAK